MFIVDFDDTLFATRPEFKEARIAAVAPLGISRKQYEDTYRIARNLPDGTTGYSTYRHAEILATLGYNQERVYAALETTTTLEQLKSFLLAGAELFLEKLKKFGEPLVLLSLGDEEFQRLKVHRTGIEKYFDRVFIVNDSKEHVLRELLGRVSDKKIWFINDRVDQTSELAAIFSRLLPVLKQSPEGGTPEQYADSGLPYFKTLSEIYDYIVAHK